VRVAYSVPEVHELGSHELGSSQHPRQGAENLEKASEWAQSHVNVSYDKFGSLGYVGVIVKPAVRYYVVMLVHSSYVGF
jgi:hypothetical protein